MEACVGNAQKTDAAFRWIPVTELEKAVALGEDEIWETLQKSWQGFRFGNAPRTYAWCWSRDGRSFYLDTDSINIDNLPQGMTYRVLVKEYLDADGSLENDIVYGFESQNDILVGMVFDKSTGQWEPGEGSVAKAVWETLKPFMRHKNIPYSDSWSWE